MTAAEFSSDHNSENVLVTGGGGFLGRVIIRRLIDRGDHVRSLSRNLYPELAAKEVDQIQGDIADLMVVKDACQDQNVVLHVAAKPPPWGKYDDYYQFTPVTQAAVPSSSHCRIKSVKSNS